MTICILQARSGSSRLPGKVLMPLQDRTMLEFEINRIRRSKKIDRLMLATTSDSSDDLLASVCEATGMTVFRGSVNDVLDRYYQAALSMDLTPNDAIVRLTGDCPLLDSEVIDRVLSAYENNTVDYASNVVPPTFPDGMDVEVFSFSALEKSWKEAFLTSDREHVTTYIRNHPEIFSHFNVLHAEDLSNIRLTVDEREDYELIKKLVVELFPVHEFSFTLLDILELLQSSKEIGSINAGFQRNEGYLKSLIEDNMNGN